MLGEEIASRPGFEAALDMTLQLMIGAATSRTLHPERIEGLVDRWKSVFPKLLER